MTLHMAVSMFRKLKAWLLKQRASADTATAPVRPVGTIVRVEHDTNQSIVPYDENLLERSRTQWQFGDWDSLANMERDTLQQHPDRAKLALLAAAGHAQKGDSQAARQFTRLAQDWGCSPRLVRQILISGIHNSLARANAILGQEEEAMKHFEAAIETGTPNADRLLKSARATFQLNQVGVPVRLQMGWGGRAGNAISLD